MHIEDELGGKIAAVRTPSKPFSRASCQCLCVAAMRFATPLIPAMLARRYKRFLADVMFDSGEMTTVHVANPGAMTGLDKPYSRVWLSDSENPLRKLRYTWELVEADFGSGSGTRRRQHHPAQSARRRSASQAGLIPELRDYPTVRREVKYGSNSRADFVLEDGKRPTCYLEVKNVHLMRKPRLAEFPDCVTARGAKHLDDLAAMVEQRRARGVALRHSNPVGGPLRRRPRHRSRLRGGLRPRARSRRRNSGLACCQ